MSASAVTKSLHIYTSAEVLATKVCRKCNRELPATAEYFYRYSEASRLRKAVDLEGTCKRCRNQRILDNVSEARKIARESKSAPGKFAPRVVGAGGPEGGFTEYQSEGFRFMSVPDSHGFNVDWTAAEAALAFMRYYRPSLVILLGDHVDFEAISRFRKAPDRVLRMHDDIAEAKKLLVKVRESAPDARIVYLKGNHEARFAHYLWEKAAALLNLEGMNLPTILGLGELGIEWCETGMYQVKPRLIAKHGNLVRSRSAYTATGEMEKNGISGMSGHTHRLGAAYKTNRIGTHVWLESGCICSLEPDYMEGQVPDWQHGLIYGTASLRGDSFTMTQAPIIRGRVMAAGMEVGP